MARRDEWLARTTRTGPGRGASVLREVAVSIGLGWLVLMTIWGVGRSGFEDRAGAFLVVGLVAGAITTVGRVWARRRSLASRDDAT